MKNATSKSPEATASAAAEELETLLYEIAPTYRGIVNLGNRLGTRSTKGGYLVYLEILAESGPQTVPDLARMRNVSRQHVQIVVNDLIEQGILEKVDNPEHKRSKLIRLSPKGRESLDNTVGRLQRWCEAKKGHFKISEVRAAKKILRQLRDEFTL